MPVQAPIARGGDARQFDGVYDAESMPDVWARISEGSKDNRNRKGNNMKTPTLNQVLAACRKADRMLHDINICDRCRHTFVDAEKQPCCDCFSNEWSKFEKEEKLPEPKRNRKETKQ